MYCPGCANENANDVRFCRRCGLDVSKVPSALEHGLPEGGIRTDWTWVAVMALLGLVFCSASLVLAPSSGPDVRTGVGFYVSGAVWLATVASVSLMKLHPSVRIRHDFDLRKLMLGLAVVLIGGGMLVASRFVGMTLLTIGALGCALVGFSLFGRLLPRVVRAQYESWKDVRTGVPDMSVPDEVSGEASITQRLEQKRDGWQLAAPPSVVPLPSTDNDEEPTRRLADTGKLPVRADERNPE